MTSPGQKLISEIVNTGLCMSCGLCVAVCAENCLEISNIEGSCQPAFNNKNCTECGLCLAVCPGAEVNLGKIQETLFPSRPLSIIGSYRKMCAGYSRDADVRAAGASGGVLTAILKKLLSSGEVREVVLLGFNGKKPYLTEYKIIKKPEDVITCAQSKYAVNHLGEVLKKVKGPAAVVTLPCQTHGLRKWQNLKIKYPNIKYILGLYCGNNLYFSATKELLKKLNIYDLNSVKKIAYREGSWPGNFEVKTLCGKVKKISKDAFNYLSFFYTIPRCHQCTDLTNEFADISFGDAWNYEGKDRGGYSIIIARTEKGEELLDKVIGDGDIFCNKVSEEEALEMHAHNLMRKKIGVFYRMKIRQNKGKANPDYHLFYNRRSSWFSVFKERIIMAITSSRPVRGIFSLLPVSFIEFSMKLLRLSWKKISGINLNNKWDVKLTVMN